MNNDIRFLGNLLLKDHSEFVFNEYCSMFIFTTENLKGYISKLELEDKKVLVPVASGDHAFESILNGASSVDMFDINNNAKHIVKLKVACIKALNSEEYISFFVKGKDSFNKDVYYNKIRNYLDEDSKMYWDYILNFYKDSKKLRTSSLFLHDDHKKDTIKNVLDYVDKDSFMELREKIDILNSSKTYIGNVLELPQLLEGNYDVMMLSNIQDYIYQSYKTDYLGGLKRYREFIKNDLMQNVNENGFIVSEYYYNNSAVPSLSKGDSDETIKFDSVYDILGTSFTKGPDQVKIYNKK